MWGRPIITVCAALVAAGLVAGPAAGADLQKTMSFSGPQPLRSDDNPNDYRLWGNRDYVKQSGTRWVKLWVSWYDVQQDYKPADRAHSWAQLDKSPNLSRLDAQVRAANADGVRVLLCLYQAFPTWATGATGSDPLSSKPAIQKLPLDLSPDGPWGWFVGYLSDRYDGSSLLSGKVDALEVVNEPNLLYWPQDDIVADTATMLRSAEQLSFVYGRQAIVGPATSDYPDPAGARPGVNTDWRTFTAALLDALGGWQPRVPVHWSQHNYRDVKYEDPPETSRAKQTIDMLAAAGWTEPELWLTEGGLNLGSSWSDPATRDAQAVKIEKNFDAMRSLPEVALWTQHGVNDVAGNDFKSGLRDDFDAARPAPGQARPAWSTWFSLDGSRPPEEPIASASGSGEEPLTRQLPGGDAGAEAEPAPATNGTPAASGASAANGASAATAASAANGASAATAAPAAQAAFAPAPAADAALPAPSARGAAAAIPCTLTAPKSFGRGIRVGRDGAFTLPGTRVTAADTGCTAAVLLTGSRIHLTKKLKLDPGSSRAIRIRGDQHLVPARVTLKIAVQGQTRTWRTRLVR